MKTRIFAMLLCLCLFLTSFGAVFAQADAKESGSPMLSGMFAAPILTGREDAWSQEDWDTAMQQMKEVGMDQIVIQYAVYFLSEYNREYYYTPTFEKAETGNEAQRNQIPYILKAAKKQGIKIFVGLPIYEDGWFAELYNAFNDTDASGNSKFLKESEAYAEKVFDDLWKQFKGEYADTIIGWYLPFEFNNVCLTRGNGGNDRVVNNYYKPLTAHIKKVTPDKLTLCSPLVYTPMKRPVEQGELNVWKELVYDIWTGSQMDIIAPQDGCGWESSMKETIVPWYQITRKACDEAQAVRKQKGWGKAIFWNNPEAYNMNPMDVMSVKRLTDNMAAVDQYVDAHVSFSLHSFVHFDKPKTGTNAGCEMFWKAYRYYVQHGGSLYLPEKPIPAPKGVKTEIKDFDLTLTFDRVDVGSEQPIVGYELWRKGKEEPESAKVRIQEKQQSKKGERVVIVDPQLTPGKTYDYSLYAADGTGNRSGKPAVFRLSVPTYGVAFNRENGKNLGKEVSVQLGDKVNIRAKGAVSDLTAKFTSAAFTLQKKDQIGKYTLNLNLKGRKKVGFLHLQFQNQPFIGKEIFLPEKVDVLADGKPIAVVYPFREYGSSPVGGVWIPIDLQKVVETDALTLIVTQKYANSELLTLRVYEAAATDADTKDYKEPVNLIQGQPVYVNTAGMSNFSADGHLFGVHENVMDFKTGNFENVLFTYKSAPATHLLTHLHGGAPSIPWGEDGNHTSWMRMQGMGGKFVMEVDLPAPSVIHAVETEWLLDRDSTVFLPTYIEVYGTTSDGIQEPLGTAYRPSEVMLDFDNPPSELNNHRIETKAYRVLVKSSKLYKKISLKIFPQYGDNAHFVQSVSVY